MKNVLLLIKKFLYCRSVELYDVQHDSWSRGVPIPQRESFASCAVVQGQVALLGGGMHNCNMTFYDPGTQCWRPAEAPYPARVHSAVASVEDGVLVLVSAIASDVLPKSQKVNKQNWRIGLNVCQNQSTPSVLCALGHGITS